MNLNFQEVVDRIRGGKVHPGIIPDDRSLPVLIGKGRPKVNHGDEATIFGNLGQILGMNDAGVEASQRFWCREERGRLAVSESLSGSSLTDNALREQINNRGARVVS